MSGSLFDGLGEVLGEMLDALAAPFERFARVFELDLRSLAIFRIGLGVLLVVDLINRGFWLSAHYTDAGILPRADLVETVWHADWLSIHLLNGGPIPQLVLFVVAGLAALALAVGYRTRLATIVSWGLLVSLHGRNPMILQGGDIVIRLLLFWGMFLPLGARFSVDATLADGEPEGQLEEGRVVSMATVAFVAQLCFLYLFAALFKDSPEWTRDFTATYYALALDQFTTPIGDWLFEQRWLHGFLTVYTLAMEAVGWVLILIPFAVRYLRLAAIGLFVSMHLGFAASMQLGLFSYIVSIAWLAFLPSWFWKRLESRFGSPVESWLGEAARRAGRAVAGMPVVGAWLERGARREPVDYEQSTAGSVACMLALCTCFWWNLATVSSDYRVYEPVRTAAIYLRLDQKWNMFAPYPLKDDGWYVIPGELKDGSRVDLFRGGAPVEWEKPADVSAEYPGQRWRKYMVNLWKEDYGGQRKYYADWKCRRWNAEHSGDRRLEIIEMYFMKERTEPDGVAEPEKVHLGTFECAEDG